jgi:hypothetical protein
MTDSQKWALWLVALAAALLTAAFIGGAWLLVTIYVVVRLVIGVGLVALIAALVANVRGTR